MTDLVPVARGTHLRFGQRRPRSAGGRTCKASRGNRLDRRGRPPKLRESGANVRDISDLTGFPEDDGRPGEDTFHPKVHGGLLGVIDNPQHAAAMEEHEIAPIDLVVVNFYPFLNTVMSGADRDTIIEKSISAVRRWCVRRRKTMRTWPSSRILKTMRRCWRSLMRMVAVRA